MKDRSQVFIVTGEPSGDLHASLLSEELRLAGNVAITAVGGARLKTVGADIFIDSSRWGAVGIPDVLRKYPTYWLGLRRVVARLLAQPPDLLVLVDFGAFNMRLLKRLGAERRPKSFYFFPPGSWGRNPRDFSDMVQLTDCVATPFPWSEQILRQQGVNAHFVGHPVIDRVKPAEDVGALRRELGVPEEAFCLGLLPGSRLIERRLLGPQMIGTAARLRRRYPELHSLFSPPPSAAGGTDRNINLAQLGDRVTVVDDSLKIVQAADLIVTAFGTATLEAAAALCPMIAIYRGTQAMWLQFRLTKLDTEFFAMPNIIAGEKVVPETIKPDETNAEALARMIRELIEDEAARLDMKRRLAAVREMLGPPGVAKRAAELALATMT